MLRRSLFLFLLFLQAGTYAQTFQPKSPLGIPLKLAGTFGELRPNHFHSGIDLKTYAREGYPVLSIAGGFIARIKVSATGFGNAVYIHHPGGYTSVYAHLHSFCDSVYALVDSLQRAGEVYELDFQPDSLRFPVYEGQVIGLSGNTGGSEGPHLHFEIRDRFSEEPLNPLAFGLPVTDTIPPEIRNVVPYYFENNKWIRIGKELKGDTLFTNRDTLGFAVFTTDPDSNSNLGIYKAELRSADSVLFHFSMDRFNFNETRYVNAHIDYAFWFVNRQKVHRLFRLSGDRFSVYRNSGDGKIILSPGKTQTATILVKDFAGNTAKREIFISRREPDSVSIDENASVFRAKADTSFEFIIGRNAFKGQAGTFYQDETLIPLELKRPRKAEYLTEPAGFNSAEIAVHIPIEISIRLTDRLRKANPEKVIIVETDEKGEIRNMHKPIVKKDVAMVRVRKAGIYAAGLDLSTPEIGAYRLWYDSLTRQTMLKVRVKDDLSGIGTVRVLQNGVWQPAMYEPRTGEVIARLRNEFPSLIDISLSDAAANTSGLTFGL